MCAWFLTFPTCGTHMPLTRNASEQKKQQPDREHPCMRSKMHITFQSLLANRQLDISATSLIQIPPWMLEVQFFWSSFKSNTDTLGFFHRFPFPFQISCKDFVHAPLATAFGYTASRLLHKKQSHTPREKIACFAVCYQCTICVLVTEGWTDANDLKKQSPEANCGINFRNSPS